MAFFSLTFVNINKSLVGVSSWAGFHKKKLENYKSIIQVYRIG